MDASSEAFRVNSDQWIEFDGYTGLNTQNREIRLLHIERNQDARLLQCRLEHTSLNDHPDYKALSYYWGPPPSRADLRSVLLDDKPVQIRPTIYKYLKTLVSRFAHALVWLDLLCINQKDAAERNEQVAVMGDIFSNAQEVYVWLGEADPDSDYAFDAISRLSPQWQGFLLYSNLTRMKRCLEYVCERPYWSRVWCVQECVVAESILLFCGTKLATWDSFFAALEYSAKETSLLSSNDFFDTELHLPALVSKVNSLSSSPSNPAGQLATTRKHGSNRMHLAHLVRDFRHCECSDIRDKLFAFRAIASDGHLLRVDYQSSLLDICVQFLSAQMVDTESSSMSIDSLVDSASAFLQRQEHRYSDCFFQKYRCR